MKEIQLTKGMVTQVDDEDFEWLNEFRWFVFENRTGEKFYAGTSWESSTVPMHRVILRALPWEIVDHLDDDGLNNQRSNIRLTDQGQNLQRMHRKKRTNSSGYRGVWKNKKGISWYADIGQSKDRIRLGPFSSPEEAARAYDLKALELYGRYAYLNFPKSLG